MDGLNDMATGRLLTLAAFLFISACAREQAFTGPQQAGRSMPLEVTVIVENDAPPVVHMSSQSLRQLGLNMGRHERLTARDFLVIYPADHHEVVHELHDSGVNIVLYALNSDHGIGEKRYERQSHVNASAVRKCASFYDMDEAQRIFLASGGPEEDTFHIDRDGDGFACEWDPGLYRNILFDALAGSDLSIVDIILTGPGHYVE